MRRTLKRVDNCGFSSVSLDQIGPPSFSILATIGFIWRHRPHQVVLKSSTAETGRRPMATMAAAASARTALSGSSSAVISAGVAGCAVHRLAAVLNSTLD
jgi:hypothetical protein